jgi:Two component regulator propeller
MIFKFTSKTNVILCLSAIVASTLCCNPNTKTNKNTQSIYNKIDTPKLNYKTGVRSILEDSKGNIWFGSYNQGVCLLQNGKLQYFTTQNGLSDNQIRNIYENKDGIIWFECGIGLSIYNHNTMSVYTTRNYGAKKK